MALPTKLKTWQHATNLNPGFNGTDKADFDTLFIVIKNALKAFPLSAWTCAGSSDSLTAGMDAVDRLAVHTDVVHSGGAHAWMVLEQSAIDTHTQLCFDFNTDVHQVNVYFSPSAGFTGGDTSNRPTAVDELVVQAPFQPISLFTSFGQGLSMRAHVMMSTDGHSTRIVTCGGNVARGFICVDVPIDPPAGWTNPVIAAATWSENAPPADALGFVFWKQGTFTFKSQGPITTMPLYMVLQGYATNGTANGTLLGYSPWPNADELSGEFPLGGVGIAHTTTVGQRGRHGYLADWYFTALSVLQGNSFPGDGSKSWVVFGNSVFPWDGGNVEMG